MCIRFGNETQYCPTIETRNREEKPTKIVSNRTQEMVKIHKNEDDNENNDADDEQEKKKVKPKLHAIVHLVCKNCVVLDLIQCSIGFSRFGPCSNTVFQYHALSDSHAM